MALADVKHGDALAVLADMPAASVDAVVTDPPYGLAFMGRGWDHAVPGPDYWTACLRVLKPGGHLLAFGGTRTAHRLAVAIEDAGFELRDTITWLYGSGFPKSLDVGKAIDKAAGATREVVGSKTVTRILDAETLRRDNYTVGATARGGEIPVTAPATAAARQWQGWGTALKPASEPVICARKPFSVVPFWGLVSTTHHALGGLLWLSASPAKRAELSSPSSPHALPADTCGSALADAVLATSPGQSATTATYSSPELASTCLSIDTSWRGILDALSRSTTTSTTATASSTTTALRTLNSLLAPVTSPNTMPNCACLTDGSTSPAPSAGADSTGAWAKWKHTLSASAPETAIAGIALGVSSVLAQLAEELSSAQAEASTARPSATTGPDERRSTPASEPIIVARKPLTGTVAANVLEWGTGALNVDATRVQMSDADREFIHKTARPNSAGQAHTGDVMNRPGSPTVNVHAAGRWPANVVLTHAPDCADLCVDGCPVAELDTQSGTSGSARNVRKAAGGVVGNGHTLRRMVLTEANVGGYDDQGGASRFFPTFRYQAKAPTRERPKVDGVAHPTVKPLALMRWLVRLVCPPGGLVLDPFAGSGTTGEAAALEGMRAILVERDATYLPLIAARLERAA